jgi:hypothetical protein
LAATDDPQLLDTTNGPLTVTLLMLTAELLLLERVKVCHAVPVPTGVLPKLKLDGVRVRVAAISAIGANDEAAIRVRIRLQSRLMGDLLDFINRIHSRLNSVEVGRKIRRTPAGALRLRVNGLWIREAWRLSRWMRKREILYIALIKIREPLIR